MKQIFNISSDPVKSLLDKQKYRIKDPLTEQLVLSLTTKIFYTLANYKMFDKYEGVIDLGPVNVIPYRSILGDIRYLLELKGLQDSPVIIQWNGKFEQKGKKKHSAFFISEKDFNVTNCLDNFVSFEQQVVDVLQAIEQQFYGAIQGNIGSSTRIVPNEPPVEEIPVMHSHVDEE